MWEYPIIDLHATWLVINPIQGCPNRCKYCFLNGVGLTGKKPKELVSAKEAVKLLKESKFYTEEIPICIESQTDAFSTPSNEKYVLELLQEMEENNIKNVKIFITKCSIKQSFINEIKKYKEKGHKFIFFLSYSGLDKDIEVGIDKNKIKQNFINLYNAEIDIIHYWRPFVPQNSTEEKIKEVYDFVKKYAKCSVAIGLKVQESFIDNIDFWEELKQNEEIFNAEGIWEKNAYKYIYSKDSKINGEYPIYQTTSCALAYTLKEVDRNSFYQEKECLDYNKCPKEQREICKKYYENKNSITENQIHNLLDKLNIKYCKEELKVKINHIHKTIEIENLELQMKEFTFLTQMTKYKIYSKKKKEDYYWNTSVNNAKQLLI